MDWNRTHARNGNIDALRLIAALGVIALHVGPYPELPGILPDLIRGAFRWCVPFFFLLTGYFLADLPHSLPRVTPERLAVPLRAFVVASLVFLPVLLARSGGDGISLSTLLRGSYGHLWYLTALIIGLLTLWSFRDSRALPWLWAAAGVILLTYIALNHFFGLTGRRYEAVMTLRELSAIPALLLGGLLRILIARGRLDRRHFGLILAGGIALTLGEAAFQHLAGGNSAELQFFAGTLPIAAGLLGLAVTLPDLAPVRLAEFGRQESLGIYLYHPAAILLMASLIAGDLRLSPDAGPGLVIWIGAALLMLAGVWLMRRYAPRLRALLDGQIPPPRNLPLQSAPVHPGE